MASSNIKLFDENKGNMLSDSEFSISNQRMNGLQTGVASSQLQNKAMYQASLIAYAIAQVMMQNGKNANDTDAVSAFVANLSGTMLQKVYDVATTAEAQAGVAAGKWMSPALVKAAIDALAAKAQNILSDNTKTLFGLGADAVPDDVLSLLNELVRNAQTSADGKAKLQTGSYTGTGTSYSTPNSLTFNFVPKIVLISGKGKSDTGTAAMLSGLNSIYVAGYYQGMIFKFNSITWNGNSVTWNGDDAGSQANTKNETYYYAAIG